MPQAEPTVASSPRIAIIGGGISGLAAALRLTELLPQARLSLYEAAPRLGGVLETIERNGFLIERSADNFLTKLPDATDLCRRLGLAEELIATEPSRRRAFVVKDGRLLPIPTGYYLMSPRRLWPLLTSPILSLRGKLRVLAEPLIAKGAADDESVASFARRRLGREAFERLVQPLVAGIYTADPERLSMAATMPEFLAAERANGSLLRGAGVRTGHFSDQSTDTATGARYNLLVAPRRGIASIIDALATRLPAGTIHLNSAVARIARAPDGQWQLDFGFWISDFGLPQAAASGDPKSEIRNPQSYDALLLAVPAHAAARLLQSMDATLAAELAAIDYAGCAVVSLGFARRQIAHPLDGFGFVVPHIERRRIIAASFASQKFPGRAPGDAVLIRVFVGGALQPELLDRPDAELRQLACDELRELLGLSGEPRMADVARWPRSMPQYHVGHVARIHRIEQLTAGHPALALAGNAYHGVGIPQCIASAHAAAARLAACYA